MITTATRAPVAFTLLGHGGRDWLLGVLLLAVLGLGAALLAGRRRQERIVEELQHSTAHVAAIVDSAMDAIVTMDYDGRITGWNPEAERMLGWRAEEVEGRLVSETLVPHRHRLDHEKGLSHFRRTGHGPILGRVRELTALRRDGTETPVELSITLAVWDGQRATFVGMLRDVSARQKAERIQGLRFVVAGVLGEARTLSEASQGVMTAVGTRLRVPMVALWTPTLGGLGSDHQWALEPGAVEGLRRATAATTIAVGTGLPGRVWSQARPLTLPEIPGGIEDVERLRAAVDAGLRHAVAIPVSSGDRVLAVLELWTASEADVDEETLRTLTDIGAQLGQFLARRRAESMQDSPERLQALLEGADEPIAVVGDDGAITALNARARALLGYTTLEVLGEDVGTLVVEQDRPALGDHVRDRMRGGHDGPWVGVTARRRDGGTAEVAVHVVGVSVGTRRVALCMLAPRSDEAGSGGLRVLRTDEERRNRPA